MTLFRIVPHRNDPTVSAMAPRCFSDGAWMLSDGAWILYDGAWMLSDGVIVPGCCLTVPIYYMLVPWMSSNGALILYDHLTVTGY